MGLRYQCPISSSMKRFIASFLTLCIFFWILPLGNFIKPVQEKTACGGGRAMHMCTMGMGKVHTDTDRSSKISFNNASSLDKDPRSASSGASNDVLLNLQVFISSARGQEFIQSRLRIHYSCSLCIASPPPKLQPLI